MSDEITLKSEFLLDNVWPFENSYFTPWISCNKGLKAKISHFFTCFFCLPPPHWGQNVLEAERPLCSWHLIGWGNTKIHIHGASQMERKRGKCWKSSIFEGKLQVFLRSFAKFLRTSFTEHLWTTASVVRIVECGILVIKKTSGKTLQIWLYSVF